MLSSSPSNWQALCDSLAAQGAADAKPFVYPNPDILHGVPLLYHHGQLVVHVRHTIDSLYACEFSGPLCVVTWSDSGALPAWRRAVCNGQINPPGLRLAVWLRTAPFTHQSPHPVFSCPTCGMKTANWGSHMLEQCPVTFGAALVGFNALGAHLQLANRAAASLGCPHTLLSKLSSCLFSICSHAPPSPV